MDRRAFSLQAAALACAATGLAGRAQAQGQGFVPTEGRDFQALARPVAVPTNGKIEVIEFFWYACPHCFAFEPVLEPWIARLPPDVAFRRMPVGFDARRQLHQRIFYTWEALGLLDRMHIKTFQRFHVEKKPIDSVADMIAFAQESGIDPAKVHAAWYSFTVQTRCVEATRRQDDYGISETPELAIGGRFVVLARPGVLITTDLLINRIRYRG
ncbi:MAG TPA: thiol:disulfide interchange protein DsbA/DsbL [Burkholderiaceae bacterium]|jgi:thiol:disulfide interchange protein DsbA|nr:thiol:disulfide interchange protein DsbA/DsbL [Burkholderiaceae bacterium]